MNKPLKPTDIANRRCLKCNKEFLSQGAGNRICKECRQINARLGPITEAQLALQRGAKRLNGLPIESHSCNESSFS